MSVFAGATAPEIGLTDSPSLAAALRAAGMRVHIGSSFADSGKVLRAALQEKVFPLLVMDEKQIGIRAWSERMSNQYDVVVLRGSDHNITTEKATYIDLPARIGDILVAAGFAVDADDPRLSGVVGTDFSVSDGSTPPTRSQPAPSPRPVHEATPAPAPTRRAAATDDIDDLFAGVPEASVSDDFDEPFQTAREDDQVSRVEPTPDPVPASSEQMEWMTQAETTKSTESPDEQDDVPFWMKDSSPVPASSHANAGGDWNVVPEDAEEHPIGIRRHTDDETVAEEEHEPVFDAEPLDPGFDPDWEPDNDVVDLNEERKYTPVPTAPFVPKPTSAPDVPAWMEQASTPQIEDEPEPEPEPVDSFEILDEVIPSDPNAHLPEVVSTDTRSLDDILAEVALGDIKARAPQPEPEPEPVVVAKVERPKPTRRCPIIVCFASKGGVGKTTCSLTLAQKAAEAGLRVTLIDGNRGQGGIRKFLRVNENVTSIYDAAVRQDPQAGLAVPREINGARASSLPPVGYAVVLAPPDALADPRVVTSQMYADVVEYARGISDLVIFDTQISERFDTTGIIESVAIPSIAGENGFGLGITNDSSEGVRNLQERLEHFTSAGVPREHLLTLVNNIGYFDESVISSFRTRYSPYSTFVGVVGTDDDFKNRYNVGIIDTENSTLAPAIQRVLRTVTGDHRFDPPQADTNTRRFGFGRRK